MTTSDFHYAVTMRQRHQELVQEAAERRLARSVQVPAEHRVAAWGLRTAAGLARRQGVRPGAARLQSVQP